MLIHEDKAANHKQCDREKSKLFVGYWRMRNHQRMNESQSHGTGNEFQQIRNLLYMLRNSFTDI